MTLKRKTAEDDTQQKCRMCKRARGSPNPMKKGTQAFTLELKFMSSTNHLCYPCRNYSSIAVMTAQDFKTINSAEEGSATHLDYMIGLTSYEEAVNSSEKGRVLTSALRKEASVDEVSEFRCVENRGIWWPAWL